LRFGTGGFLRAEGFLDLGAIFLRGTSPWLDHSLSRKLDLLPLPPELGFT
jgi:hypothetical protein